MLASQIEAYVRRRGAELNLSIPALNRAIDDYSRLRESASFFNIERVRPKKTIKDFNYDMWNQWISYTFTIDNWVHEVVGPVYGTEVEEWHNELFFFLGSWIRESPSILQKFDSTPEEEYVEKVPEIDPYLADYEEKFK